MISRIIPRKGVSLVELLVGIAILGVVGMGLTRIMVAQARYFDHQKTSNKARNVSRGPLNRVVSDIRMVEAQSGISIATPTLIRARVPFAIGVVCVTGSGGTHLSLLPSDSAMYAAPGYSGYAWRDGQGIYHYKVGGNVKDENGDLTSCNAAGVGT
ncbi:MAG: prepilin-type N-terminal cleavage/methylation domain-containing protein, partial [Gemmatimonadales bacterium]